MKLNLITPPDKLLNKNLSFLLVCPSERIKQDFNVVIKDLQQDVNVYLFEETQEDNTTSWLIDVANIVDYIILDSDNVSLNEWIIGYLLAFNNCFYLTTGESRPYNNICMNRIYDLSWIVTKEGENIEKE